MSGKTVVCRKDGTSCVAAPCKPTKRETAHQQVVKHYRNGSYEDYIGGSIKSDGRIEYDSGSLNKTHFGSKTARGKAKRNMKRRLESGRYTEYDS